MRELFESLQLLDEKLFAVCEQDEFDNELFLLLFSEREQTLHNIMTERKSVPDFDNSPDWQNVILRTRQIVHLMQSKTQQLGEQLKKYRHGSKSVQRYQQFL